MSSSPWGEGSINFCGFSTFSSKILLKKFFFLKIIQVTPVASIPIQAGAASPGKKQGGKKIKKRGNKKIKNPTYIYFHAYELQLK